jgi:hypothetical protein
MPMNTEFWKKQNLIFEKGTTPNHFNEGWIPQFETKQTVDAAESQ